MEQEDIEYGLLNILKNNLKISIDQLNDDFNDMAFQLGKHKKNNKTVKTMKKQVRALVTECNSLIQEVKKSLKTDNNGY
jgi:non-homologous end joining protein Ku